MRNFMISALLIAATLTIPLLGSEARAALQAVGPVGAVTTIPEWYEDSNGLALAPCLDQNGFCLLPPEFDPAAAPPASLLTILAGAPPIGDLNFPVEAFYWIAESQMDVGPAAGARARLRIALEVAFGGANPPFVVPGQGITFVRINMARIGTGLTPNSTFTVTHPYGSFTFNSDLDGASTAGVAGQTFRAQEGCGGVPCPFDLVLPQTITQVGPFLTGITGPVTDPVTGNKYIGSPASPTLVTGSPNGTNVFRITGPDIGGLGIDTVETPLFTLAGRIVGMEVAPASGDFGLWKLAGPSTAATFTLTNRSGAPETITLSPSNPAFSIPVATDNCTTRTVAPVVPPLPSTGGNTCTFDVVFTPTADGPVAGDITINSSRAPVVKVAVTGIGDGLAPALTISPATKFVNTLSPTISGTVSDLNGVRSVAVAVNGGAAQNATVTGSNWSLPNPLGFNLDSLNTIVVATSDTALPAPGNQATLSDTVTTDMIVPSVAIDALASATTSVAIQALSGTVSDTNGVSSVGVNLNGSLLGLATVVPAAPPVPGTWSFTVNSLPVNQVASITALASDPAGNQTTSAPVSVTFVVPHDGDLNMDGAVNISDALGALRVAVGLDVADPQHTAHGDVFPLDTAVPAKPVGDNKIDVADALLTLRKVVQLVTF